MILFNFNLDASRLGIQHEMLTRTPWLNPKVLRPTSLHGYRSLAISDFRNRWPETVVFVLARFGWYGLCFRSLTLTSRIFSVVDHPLGAAVLTRSLTLHILQLFLTNRRYPGVHCTVLTPMETSLKAFVPKCACVVAKTAHQSKMHQAASAIQHHPTILPASALQILIPATAD